MGYFVRIIESTARIPKAHLQRAYEKMCALNTTHHNLKRGGSHQGGKKTASWFSWMDADYPSTCKDAQAILDMLGFYTEYDESGDLLITGYDNKTGQEDLFLDTIENEATGSITWLGEGGERWSKAFRGHDVIEMACASHPAPPKLLK